MTYYDYKKIYSDMLTRQSSVLEDCCSGELENFSASYMFISDFEKWIIYLEKADEVILYRTAIDEYAKVLYLMICGLYRESYIALRFFLEHTLFGIYLSTNKLNYRLWTINKFDMKWSIITDEDSGIFSKKFFLAFSPELIEYNTELLEICKEIYRELSEYTHGNLPATKVLPKEWRFDQEVFSDINQKIESIRYLITFLFFVRYKFRLNAAAIAELENPIIDVIGQHPEVQAFFGLARGSDV